jgi:hypothetical protein
MERCRGFVVPIRKQLVAMRQEWCCSEATPISANDEPNATYIQKTLLSLLKGFSNSVRFVTALP